MLARSYGALYRLPRWVFYGAAALFLAALFVLGAMPTVVSQLPSPFPNTDKAYHVAAYATLTMLLWFGLKTPRLLPVLVLVGAAGLADELHQATLAFRTAGADDWLADMLAGLIVATCLRALHAKAVASPFCGESLLLRRVAN